MGVPVEPLISGTILRVTVAGESMVKKMVLVSLASVFSVLVLTETLEILMSGDVTSFE
jgi:hypothetical protein